MIGLAVTVLLTLTVVCRKAERSWFAPATVLSVYWLVMLALASLAQGFAPRAAGAWIIVVSVVAFAVGSLPFSVGVGKRERVARELSTPPPWTALTPLVGTVSALGAVVLTLRATGVAPVLGRGVDAALVSSNAIAVGLFSGDATVPVIVAPLMSLTYMAAATAGITHLAVEHRWGPRVALALTLSPIAASGVVALLTTRRFGFLLTSLLTIGSLGAARMLPRPRFALLRREVLVLAAATVSIAVVFVAAAVLRIGQVDSTTGDVLGSKLRTYALGSVPAFTTWYDGHRREEFVPLGVGVSTVEGFTLVAPRGVSRNFDSRVDVGADSTNVYTVFRTVIEDVGSAGAIVFWMVLGVLVGRMWQAVRAGPNVRGTAAVSLAFWWSFVALGQAQSIFIFANVAVALVGSLAIARLLDARSDVSGQGLSLKLRDRAHR